MSHSRERLAVPALEEQTEFSMGLGLELPRTIGLRLLWASSRWHLTQCIFVGTLWILVCALGLVIGEVRITSLSSNHYPTFSLKPYLCPLGLTNTRQLQNISFR